MVNSRTSIRTFVEGVERNMWKEEGSERSSEVGECKPLSLISLAWEVFKVGIEITCDQDKAPFFLCTQTPLGGYVFSIRAGVQTRLRGVEEGLETCPYCVHTHGTGSSGQVCTNHIEESLGGGGVGGVHNLEGDTSDKT